MATFSKLLFLHSQCFSGPGAMNHWSFKTLVQGRNENSVQIETKNIRDANGDSQFNDGSWSYNAAILLESLVSETLDNSMNTICDAESKMSKDDFDNLIH